MVKKGTIGQSLSIRNRQDSMRLVASWAFTTSKMKYMTHITDESCHVRDNKNTYYLFVIETCQIVSFVRYIKYMVFGNYNLLV